MVASSRPTPTVLVPFERSRLRSYHGEPGAVLDRRRALGGFMAFGLFWGAWGAVLPAVQASSGSTDGELGTALLMIGLGALLSMRLTGRLVDRLGAGVLPVVMGVFAAVGVLPAFAGASTRSGYSAREPRRPASGHCWPQRRVSRGSGWWESGWPGWAPPSAPPRSSA